MLNLGTVWDDRSFGPEAVLILHDMISRNLQEGTEGHFIVWTDFPDDLGPWVDKRPLLAPRYSTVMFPLGCVIVRSLDCLLDGKMPETEFYTGEFPKTAAVVIFQDQRPQDLDNWVSKIYRIGGGSSVEMSYLPNVNKEQLKANMLSALQRECAWFEPKAEHDGTALIVGGGPSLSYDLMTLRYMANSGQIFALNNVPAYLETKGIIPDFHVMLDAHPLCLNFISPHIPMTRYYASQCDPSVLEAAGDSLVCWHGGGEAMNELGFEGCNFHSIVGGGSTGATRAMVLAYGLGYRKFHLFGLDSSYEGERGHAYDQPDYQKFVTVTCGEEDFKTSPQLLGQAEDFKLIVPDLMAAACEITVHGSGLLKAIASQMAA